MLEAREVLGGGLADLLLQGDHQVPDHVGESLRRAAQGFQRGALVAQGDPDRLEGIVGLDGVDGLLAGGGDLASGDLELDLPGHEQGGQEVARGVGGPAEGGLAEVVEQALAVHRAALVDVVAQADQRLVVGPERGPPRHGLHQAQGVEVAAYGCRIGDLEEFLGGVGGDAHRGLAVAVEDLLGHVGEQLFGGLQQVRVQGRDSGRLTTEHKGTALQGLLDLALELGGELGGAVQLAGAVVLDLLVGLVAVQFGDALAAVDFVGQVVQFRLGAGQEPDEVATGVAAGVIQQPVLGGLVVAGGDQFHQGLDGVVLARQAGDRAAGLGLEPGGHGQGVLMADAGERIEGFAQGLVENALHIHGA